MTEVTRSMEATSTNAVVAAAQRRRAMSSGWWGMVLLVATEATLFGSLIAAYFYLRFNNPAWPMDGIAKPSVTEPLVYTGMLVATALPTLAAVMTARRGRVGVAWLCLAIAFAVQGTYLGLQIHLLTDTWHDFTPATDAYGSIYYTLLIVHHAHVAVGLALSAWVLAKLARGMTNYRFIALRAVAVYWYFVIALGIAVTLTTLYPSL
jgi:heme/copper-type cytochrome/quinol oxidase subunit 3